MRSTCVSEANDDLHGTESASLAQRYGHERLVYPGIMERL